MSHNDTWVNRADKPIDFTMMQRIKSFYNKDYCVYSQGYVNPLEYHKTFFFFFKAFRVTGTESKSKFDFFNQNVIIFILTAIAEILSLISVSYGVHILDINHVTEAGAYVIVMLYGLMILSCTKSNVFQYNSLLEAMKDDFQYVCAEGYKYRLKFFQNQLETWKMSLLSIIFTAAIPVGMASFSAISLIYFFATRKEDEHRPMLFPLWLFAIDVHASPAYEMFFIFSNICPFIYAYNYIFMIQTQIVWVRHITTKADMVIWSLQDLLVDVHPAKNTEEYEYFYNCIKTRMREILIQHQSMYRLMEEYAKVYKKLLMYEQKCCGPLVCLTAYCTAEKLDQGEVNLILILLGIATFVLHYIPSQLCTFLAMKVRSICDACWDTPFWNAGLVIRPYYVLIMQRSLRPLPLQAPGFEDISIQTFSNKMASAYSLFNMLRQANKS